MNVLSYSYFIFKYNKITKDLSDISNSISYLYITDKVKAYVEYCLLKDSDPGNDYILIKMEFRQTMTPDGVKYFYDLEIIEKTTEEDDESILKRIFGNKK